MDVGPVLGVRRAGSERAVELSRVWLVFGKGFLKPDQRLLLLFFKGSFNPATSSQRLRD